MNSLNLVPNCTEMPVLGDFVHNSVQYCIVHFHQIPTIFYTMAFLLIEYRGVTLRRSAAS